VAVTGKVNKDADRPAKKQAIFGDPNILLFNGLPSGSPNLIASIIEGSYHAGKSAWVKDQTDGN
jgi:hypothetical protein